jgi:GntR family transcriptional regulator/MocR family aminotransferase
MVLPSALMEEFRCRLGFYSCTGPSFEQYTLARFLSRGHFEKHINRMRKFYRQRRNTVVSLLQTCSFSEFLTILELDAGLHFLLRIKTPRTDRQLKEGLAKAGIRIRALSDYYHDAREDMHCLVVNYSGIKEEDLVVALKLLESIM